MLVNLRTLRTFVEVVRQGSFSQAADVVSLTQSTVSKAVKTLEDELGTPLLSRIGHRSELTAAGEIVYRRALTLLAERNDLLTELNDLRGLKGGVLASVCHPWAVVRFSPPCSLNTAPAIRISIFSSPNTARANCMSAWLREK